MVMANILPFTETEPAILANRDGFFANGVAFEAIHGGRSYKCEVNRTYPETTTDQSPIDAIASIRFNGDLLLTRAKRMRKRVRVVTYRFCGQKRGYS